MHDTVGTGVLPDNSLPLQSILYIINQGLNVSRFPLGR